MDIKKKKYYQLKREKIGKKIRYIRDKEKGYKQDKFAYEIELDKKQYGKIELGKSDFLMETFLKIADGLNMKPSDILRLLKL